MPTITESKISSGEIGIVWVSYNVKTMVDQFMGVFIQNSSDQKAKDLLIFFQQGLRKLINENNLIFGKEKAVNAHGFDSGDIYSDAPSLFDDLFHIMFVRTAAKIIMGFASVKNSMSYRKDVRDYFKNSSVFAYDMYDKCTDYLTEQCVLARPAYTTMPKNVEFVESKKYITAMPFAEKRVLNTLEIALIHSIIEAEVFGLTLMTGFAQVAKNSDVSDYFIRGKKMSKKMIGDLTDVLLQENIEAPATWSGKATDSVESPFSDKMMMYLVGILNSFSLSGGSMGILFNLRSDLRLMMAAFSAKIYDYAIDGGKLMIENKWMEKPPEMENRKELIKSKT